MPDSVIKCPECGGENRYGAGRCIHCAALMDGHASTWQPNNLQELSKELEELRLFKERAAEARARETPEERLIRIEAESLKVLPDEAEADVVLMEPVSFPWLRYALYAIGAIVVIVLGVFAYKVMFPPPLLYATVSNYTERAGSPLYKSVLAVVSKHDYGRAEESLLENYELFDNMVKSNTAALIPNGTRVEVSEYSKPYSMVKYEGTHWFVLTDYVNMVNAKAEAGLELEGEAGVESF